MADGEHWRAMQVRYHEELGERQDDLLVETFGRAWREFPSFFPSAGELADLLTRVAKQHRGAVRRLPEAVPETDPKVLEMIREIASGKRL